MSTPKKLRACRFYDDNRGGKMGRRRRAETEKKAAAFPAGLPRPGAADDADDVSGQHHG